MPLSRLQSTGLLLSACWAFGVTLYVRHAEMPKAQNFAMSAYFVCTEQKAAAGDRNIDPCIQNVEKDWDARMNRKWRDIAYASLLPIAAGWLVGFCGVLLQRRKKPPPDKAV